MDREGRKWAAWCTCVAGRMGGSKASDDVVLGLLTLLLTSGETQRAAVGFQPTMAVMLTGWPWKAVWDGEKGRGMTKVDYMDGVENGGRSGAPGIRNQDCGPGSRMERVCHIRKGRG